MPGVKVLIEGMDEGENIVYYDFTSEMGNPKTLSAAKKAVAAWTKKNPEPETRKPRIVYVKVLEGVIRQDPRE